MAPTVKIPEQTVESARIQAAIMNRTIGGQIDYWAKIGRLAELNPGLTFDLIQKLMRENRLDQHLEKQINAQPFSAVSLNTKGFHFDRDEANARYRSND